MPLDKQKVKNTLLEKFEFQEVEGTKHERIAFFHNGKKVATTGFSRGTGRDLGESLLKIIANEILVSNLGFFKEMIICTKSRQEYLRKLNDGGFIENIPD